TLRQQLLAIPVLTFMDDDVTDEAYFFFAHFQRLNLGSNVIYTPPAIESDLTVRIFDPLHQKNVGRINLMISFECFLQVIGKAFSSTQDQDTTRLSMVTSCPMQGFAHVLPT